MVFESDIPFIIDKVGLVHREGFKYHLYHRDFNWDNENKICVFKYDELFPSDSLQIIFTTREKPYIQFRDWKSAENP